MKSYKTLQAMATKIAPFQCKINGMGVVQGELCNLRYARHGQDCPDQRE